MRKLKYDIKRLIRAVLRHTRDLFGPKNGIPWYYVKWKTLDEFYENGSPVIETGTYLGESTSYFSRHYKSVISFEPYGPLAEYNSNRFRKKNTIRIINQKSESGLKGELKNFSGGVNFWLDGHFSGDGTFGDQKSIPPIIAELNEIFQWCRSDLRNVAYIAIDDARLFTGDQGYPTLKALCDLCAKENYRVAVINDIFLVSRCTNDRWK